MYELTFEYEFVVDHEDFKGSISCSKTIKTETEILDPDLYRKLYELNMALAVEEFLSRWTILEENE